MSVAIEANRKNNLGPRSSTVKRGTKPYPHDNVCVGFNQVRPLRTQCDRRTEDEKNKEWPKGVRLYRCSRYNQAGHPRTRVNEAEFVRQVLALFDRMRVEKDEVCEWIRVVLSSKTRDSQLESKAQLAEIQRQETLLANQQDRLLNMRIEDQVDDKTFADSKTHSGDHRCYAANCLQICKIVCFSPIALLTTDTK